MRLAVEEHGGGKQFLRFRTWPNWSRIGLALAALFGALAIGATHEEAWPVAAILGATALLLVAVMLQESATATAVLIRAIEGHADAPEPVVQPSTNGHVAQRARLSPGSVSPNGSHAEGTNGSRPAAPAEHDREVGAAHGSLGELPSGARGIAFPSPANMRDRGLNITEHED
jgi:hypothetical protein